MIEKELVKCKELIGSTEHEHSRANRLWRKVRICVRRLEGLIEGLVQANERLSIVIEGQGEAQYVENLIDKDWAYISVVTDCCYNLVNIENSVKKFPVVICSANQLKRQSAQIDQILMNERQQQLRNNLEDGTVGEACYSCVDSTADVDSYGSGGEDCYSCVNSTADVDRYGSGGKGCYSYANSTGGFDSYGTSVEDCFSCVDSTGKKEDSSFEDQSPGNWCCSLNISTFHEEFFSCYNNNRNMYCYMCTDGKKGRYVNNLGCARSGEDYTGFEDRDRGKPRKFCEIVFDNENCTNYFGRSVDKNRHEVCTKNPSNSV